MTTNSDTQSKRWPRRRGESDSTYFMRVLHLARHRYPDLEEYKLWFGVCDETGLECLHPWHLRECRAPLRGTILLKDFIASEPPRHMESPDYRERVLAASRCPVCDTWDPTESVDIRKQRGRATGLALTSAFTKYNN